MGFIAGRIHADSRARLAFNRSLRTFFSIILTTPAIKIMTLIIAINSPFDNEALPSLPDHFAAGKLKELEGNLADIEFYRLEDRLSEKEEDVCTL